MNFQMKLKAAFLSLAVLASPALAETQADRDTIAASMDGLVAAIQAGEFDKTLDTIPPKMMEAMAAQAGMSADQMRAAVAATTQQMMGVVKIESYEYDLEAATFGKTDIREYALIPTSSVMESMGQKMKASGNTLAMQDEGQWYLLRIEEPAQVGLLRSVYPDMADVEITSGQIVPVQ